MPRRARKRHAAELLTPLVALLAFLAVGPSGGATAAPTDPDLALIKSDSPDPVTAGSALTYTIGVSNAGPGPASNVVVTDDLPAEVDPLSATSSPGSCQINGKKVTCFIGSVNDLIVAQVTIKGTVKANTNKTSISNTAAVSSDNPDGQPANNTDTEVTTVIASGSVCAGKAATIVGTPGDDTLRGTKRMDVILALAGDDQVFALRGRDQVCARAGNDVVGGGAGDDGVRGGAGDDVLLGGAGDDLLRGRGGADVLRGNRGRDRLRGGRGVDLLAGGAGFDSCRGGPGFDRVRRCEG